jgi:hypothetical protein
MQLFTTIDSPFEPSPSLLFTLPSSLPTSSSRAIRASLLCPCTLPLTSPYPSFRPALTSRLSPLAASRSHEIAYIFGQLSSPHSIPSLLRVLRDPIEEDMVRHEAAEALGGIASDGAEDEVSRREANLPPGGVLQVLREWAVKQDAPVVVRESCQVAIDMWEVSGVACPMWHIPHPIVSFTP